MDDEAKVLIRAGDVEIDISGAQNSVDEIDQSQRR